LPSTGPFSYCQRPETRLYWLQVRILAMQHHTVEGNPGSHRPTVYVMRLEGFEPTYETRESDAKGDAIASEGKAETVG
jgi:hypothetical protein